MTSLVGKLTCKTGLQRRSTTRDSPWEFIFRTKNQEPNYTLICAQTSRRVLYSQTAQKHRLQRRLDWQTCCTLLPASFFFPDCPGALWMGGKAPPHTSFYCTPSTHPPAGSRKKPYDEVSRKSSYLWCWFSPFQWALQTHPCPGTQPEVKPSLCSVRPLVILEGREKEKSSKPSTLKTKQA